MQPLGITTGTAHTPHSLFPSQSCPDLKDSSPSSQSTSPTSPAVLSPTSNSHNQWFTKQRSQRSPKPSDHHTSSPSNRKRSPASDLPEIRYLRRIDCNDNIDRIKQSLTKPKIRIDDCFIEQTVRTPGALQGSVQIRANHTPQPETCR